MNASLRSSLSFAPAILVTLLLAGAAASALPQEKPSGNAEPGDLAPWYVSYQRGVQAMVNDQWEEATGLFEKALQEREPTGTSNRTYGMWQVDYVPYYNLAVCYFYLGRDAEALAALKQSDSLQELPPDSTMRLKSQRIRRALSGSGGKGGAVEASQVSDGLKLLLQAGGAERAVEVFQDMVSGREDDPQIHLYLGLAYARSAAQAGGDKARFWENLARTEFRRVRQINPRQKLPEGLFTDEIERLYKDATTR